jgi:two-component system nitrate/nitrite response regulator NarL
MLRLVLVDDHPLILDGLERLFCGQEGYEVLARCTNGEDALAAVRRSRPDILILNLRMPGMDGIAVIRALKEEGIPTRVMVLTSRIDEVEALECLRLGVAGIVLKDMEQRQILQCAEKIAAGEVWLERQSFSRVLEHLLRREAGFRYVADRLSQRELETLRLCAKGLSNADIAACLSLTEGTVKAHLHHVYQKLGLKGRADLTRFAHENGLV